MKQCPYCTHPNREGYFFCEECGRRLSGDATATLPTRTFVFATKDLPKPLPATWGTSNFDINSTIVMVIRDADQPLHLNPVQEVSFGRLDSSSSERKPDIDLTPFGALEKGVSRLHCAIHREELTLTIVDLGSSNGTHLNGQRLTPEVPRVLRDGDEIQLGKLVTHIYFKGSTSD
jgi:hypothetical protein